ncbi:Cytochrome P450 84A1 [Platanthera zijinensis]|uniref:Cytochrome P450 84A1 n=1 Tax=Platanthera zijinensis TaxID=2320716 RepID=A0AAP0C282_9ASPA
MLLMNNLTHRGLAKLADHYGGLLHLRLGFLHAVAVSTPEIAKQVLQVQDNLFSNRPATIAITYLTYNRADMAFAHYGPFWRQMRKLCVVKLFSRKRAESWASVRDEVNATVRTLADKAAAGSPVNVGELVFSLTMNITFRAAFGSQSSRNEEEFLAILQEFSKLFGAFNIGDFIPWLRWFDPNRINERLKKARVSLDRFIDAIIDHHRRNPKPVDAVDADMVDDMLAFFVDRAAEETADGGPEVYIKLTKDNIKAIIMDVMFGGTETVASAIEWAMAEMMRNPQELTRVQAELAQVVGPHRMVHESDLDNLPYLKCAVKETLRLHPPIPLLLHETAADCSVAGYSIPAGTRVIINAWAIGRNKAAWTKDADAFRPFRFAPGGRDAAVDFRGNFFELIPFGSGRRSCPGMQLGLYALELAVAQLVHCFEWELPDGMSPSELSMEDVFGLTAPRSKRLVAIPTPRLSCSLHVD